MYQWEVGGINDIVIKDEVFSGTRTFSSNQSISAKNVTLDSGELTFSAGQKIDIDSDFDIKAGASFDAVIQ